MAQPEVDNADDILLLQVYTIIFFQSHFHFTITIPFYVFFRGGVPKSRENQQIALGLYYDPHFVIFQKKKIRLPTTYCPL